MSLAPAPALLRAPTMPAPTRALRRTLGAVAALGGIAFLLGLLVAPARVWPAWLLSVVLLTGLGLSGTVFLALHYVTGARWSTGLRRVAEAMTEVLPLAALAFVALAFGAQVLWPWADPALVRGDEILEHRVPWMNLPFVLARAAVCFGVWTLFSRALVARSRRQDEDHDAGHRAKNARTSGFFLAVLAVTFSVACFDWLLSLERHWFSTMFALYEIAGLLLSGFAAISILVVALRRKAVLGVAASDDVLHDLGKLVFGFSLFWGYLWFSQWMLIWYANLPEETPYYASRHAGAWAPLTVANVLLNWTIPFVVLMPRRAKRNATVLLRASAVVLVGRWVDLFVTIQPPSAGPTPDFGPWDVALPAGAVAVFVLAWWRAMERAPVVPRGEA